jgi:acyl-CoA synthetase (AMP-forming)/AMP-acid ligase II
MQKLAEIEARLTAPGGPFEIAEEEVLGERMAVFRKRPRSLRELLAGSAAHGDKEYIVQGERRISYAEHLRLVGSVARGLRERYGVQPGDRVAILAENRPEWILSFWAAVSAGAVVAALNGWWTADEIAHGIANSEPRLLVGDRKRLARLEGRDPGVPTLEIESEFEKLAAHAPGAPLPDVPIAEDDPAVILYTSGTTGRAKGAVNTHRGLCGFVQLNLLHGVRLMLAAAAAGAPRDANPPAPCMLVTVPLFHMSGLHAGAVMMLAVGARTVWRAGRFDPAEVLRLIEQERVTQWAGLGSMAPRVLNHPDLAKYDLSSLRNLGSGGAPTSPALLARMKQVAPTGAHGRGLGYGLSESVATISVISGGELEERPGSVGRVQPTVQVEIRAPDGRVLGPGEEGEIHARSPYLMREYWRDPEATRKALLPGRWLATGDIGRIEDGYLYINSRARDLILRGAENVYPAEVEHRLEAHPDVVEAAVVGVDHPELGQEVKAIVVPVRGAALDPAALARWCAQTLAPYKVPAHFELRAEPLPRNAVGKVLKNVLRGESDTRFIED